MILWYCLLDFASTNSFKICLHSKHGLSVDSVTGRNGLLMLKLKESSAFDQGFLTEDFDMFHASEIGVWISYKQLCFRQLQNWSFQDHLPKWRLRWEKGNLDWTCPYNPGCKSTSLLHDSMGYTSWLRFVLYLHRKFGLTFPCGALWVLRHWTWAGLSVTNCQPTSLCVCVRFVFSQVIWCIWIRLRSSFLDVGKGRAPFLVIRINCKSELVIAFRATPCVPRSAPSISQIPRACEH